MFVFNLVFVIGIIFPALLSPTDAFHTCWHNGATFTSSKTPSIPRMTRRYPSIPSFSHFAVMSDKQGEEEEGPNLRDKLRKATGFSMTAFRSTWRTATGVSLTAIYASALAASGLWVRRAMSSVLSIFPAWFRYFLQPFLVLYYAPLFILRGLTGPTRRDAKAKHELLVDGWKEAVQFAEKTKKDGYWPVVVTEDGDFELKKPPKPDEARFESLPDAVAESVEQAMEQKSSDKA